jgi:protein TonB
MFEGTLVESRGLVASGTQKWTAVASLTVQCAVMGLVLAIPLLRPEVMRVPMTAPPLVAPFLPKPVVELKPVVAASASGTVSLQAAGAAALARMGSTIWPRPGMVGDGAAPGIDIGQGMKTGAPSGSVLGTSDGVGSRVAVVQAKGPGVVRISTGVSDGLLLAPIRPVYPAIARAAGVQGAVVVEATISTAGRIESVHAVSGPMLLQRAAMDAVGAARYRPYLLNGEATEVKATITVVFTLGG